MTEFDYPPVEIPFSPDMGESSINGTKICTSRNKKYGEPGDWFKIGDHRFLLKRVERHTLWYVAHILFEQEGFGSPRGFIDKWNALHPKRRYQDEDKVWVHYYRKLDEGE